MNQKMFGKRINIPKYQGIYYRESSKRRHLGKSDRCFDICYRDGKGKLIWEKIGWVSEGYNAAVADQLRAERVRAVRHGDELPREKEAEITLGEVWKYYDEWLNTGKKDSDTDRSYYKNHIEPVFANRVLSKISPFDLEKLKKDLTIKNLAPATVKHILVLIRQLINKAIAWNKWHGENPVKKIKLPKLNNRRERFLSKDEAQILLAELKKVSSQLYNISLLSLHTGMRAGEVFSLKWGHIDKNNRIIHIADPKSGHARKVFMTRTIKEMFKSIKNGEPEELIFKSRERKKIDRISYAFRRAVDRLDFNKGITDPRQIVTFHTLRHTFASWLALQGTPILTIKELLGHQSLAMTERYSHLTPDHKKSAVDGIESMFAEGNLSH
jgi:integrase